MKNLAILLFTLCLISSSAYANNAQPDCKKIPPNPEFAKQIKPQNNFFEHKLKLTEVQKLKAEQLRKQGHEKMEPVMKQIMEKRKEAVDIRDSKTLSSSQKEAQLAAIDKDLAILDKQAKEIRKQNIKDFESILTYSQKRTLKQMKKDGRKNFDKNRLTPPPCPKHPNFNN